MFLPLSPLAKTASSRHRLYRAHIVPGGYERPMPSPPQCETLRLAKAAAKPLGLVQFSFAGHGITREAYSFCEKLATSDLNSPLRISSTRSFPPPSRLFLDNLRNNPSPGVFVCPTLNPSPVVRPPSSLITRGGYSFREKIATSDFYSTLRLSDTRPFPPPGESFLATEEYDYMETSENGFSAVKFDLNVRCTLRCRSKEHRLCYTTKYHGNI